MQSADAEKWKKAMEEEMQCIKSNQTWTVVPLPPGRRAVGSKWVFKTKHSQNGEVHHKARLVAQCFTQQYGVDYDEVFAPVASSTTLKMLLTVSGMRNYSLRHYDVKSAFLNGDLKEEIFMKPPPGVNENNKVYRLKKSLYGLKQSANVWNLKLHETLLSNGCVQSPEDSCLYSHTSGGEVTYLLIYVDDILAASSSQKLLKTLMKNVGEAKNFLGIEIHKNNEGFYEISQSECIKNVLEVTELKNAKVSQIPMDVGYHKLVGEPLTSNDEYRKIIGMLLYLSVNSRPDIAAAAAILSQKVSCPTLSDLNEAKRVVRYLNGTQNIKLKMGSSRTKHDNVYAFSDSDWAEDRNDRKLNSGIICMFKGAAVSWKSKKQTIVATSSAEAEYVALSQTVKELIWLKRLAECFGIKDKKALKVFSDSQSAIAMITKPKLGNRSKHIDTKYHHVKDAVSRSVIQLEYVPSEVNATDILTKPLGKNKVKQFRESMGFTPVLGIEEECSILRVAHYESATCIVCF